MPDKIQDIAIATKVAAINGVLRAMTGEAAKVESNDKFVRLILSDNQRTILQQNLSNQLRAKPGDIRLDYVSVILPPVMQVYGKFLIMALVAAFLLGSLTMPTGK